MIVVIFCEVMKMVATINLRKSRGGANSLKMKVTNPAELMILQIPRTVTSYPPLFCIIFIDK